MAEVRSFPDGKAVPTEITVDDFSAYMPQHTYIFRPTGEMWTAAGVNGRIKPVMDRDGPIKANVWIDRNAPVEQMTWWPGEQLDIRGRLFREGGWVDKPGCTVFNLYREPTIKPKPGDASRWHNHVRDIYGDQAGHIIAWCAQRVQDPGTKINHSIVLGGEPGIGKDTILEPVKQAIGEWNFMEVSPKSMEERFNPFLRSVILRVSEAHDRGEMNRYAFYEHTKTLMAAPPSTLRIDEKNIREYRIPNVCGIIITTNRRDSLYLPSNDRRHYVAWSEKTQADFDPEYWNSLYNWYEHGGYEIVADYLGDYDLTEFDPKAPPVKTPAFWELVANSIAPENAEFMTALENMAYPPALTVEMLRQIADSAMLEWLNDRKNRPRIGHRFEECGYTRVINPDNKQGLYKVSGKHVAIYAKAELALRDRFAAASQLT